MGRELNPSPPQRRANAITVTPQTRVIILHITNKEYLEKDIHDQAVTKNTECCQEQVTDSTQMSNKRMLNNKKNPMKVKVSLINLQPFFSSTQKNFQEE